MPDSGTTRRQLASLAISPESHDESAAVAVLAELGGLAEWRAEGAAVEIRGFGCPLREAVDDSPLVCRIAAALLSEVVGHDVAECCERGESPSCRFRFASA